jgi:2-keto-4-pentenoate hydratase
MTDTVHQAADLLIAARRDPAKRLAALPEALRPADQAAAYAIQRLVAATFPAIGGWKVGAAGPDAPPICGALPASGVVPSPAVLSSAMHTMRGIEAEVAFRIGRDLPPRGAPYSRDEVMDAMQSAHPAIEVLESRYLDPDAVDALSNLADTQMHGGFVWGAPVADWRGIDFAAETVVQEVDGAAPLTRTGNPAGDMVRLVVWLANEGSVWAGGLKAGQFVTCGSWTGKTLAGPNATVRVHFPSLGVAELSFR